MTVLVEWLRGDRKGEQVILNDEELVFYCPDYKVIKVIDCKVVLK